MFDLNKLYKKELFDLGKEAGEKYKNIYSPMYDEATVRSYVHDFYLDNAEEWDRKYTAFDYFRSILKNAFAHVETDFNKENMILDIGSGAGNTIIPLLEIFPNSKVIGSDISHEMLVFVNKYLQDMPNKDNCRLIQLNAEEMDFYDDTFDIIVGAALLHHLFDPSKAIECCSRILKKGGCAIFFDPFENGNSMLRLLYKNILDKKKFMGLNKKLKEHFRNFILDVEVRKGRDKSADHYKIREDKWYFTKSYFEELKEKFDYEGLIIYPLHEIENMFRAQTKQVLIYGGMDESYIPDWAWQMTDEYDKSFSEDFKKDLLIEGCVIFKK